MGRWSFLRDKILLGYVDPSVPQPICAECGENSSEDYVRRQELPWLRLKKIFDEYPPEGVWYETMVFWLYEAFVDPEDEIALKYSLPMFRTLLIVALDEVDRGNAQYFDKVMKWMHGCEWHCA